MRRITELYGALREEEFYRDGTDPIMKEEHTFDEEEKRRILERTWQIIQQETTCGKRKGILPGRRRLRVLVIAAALFAALTVSAAGYLQIRKELADSLDLPAEQVPGPIASMMTDFPEGEVSVSEHGVIVRAEQAISDGRTACICFAVELPEGVYQEDPDGDEGGNVVYFRGGPVGWSAGGSGTDVFTGWREVGIWIGGRETGCGPMLIERSAEEPGRYYVIEMFKTEEPLDGSQEVRLTLGDLGYLYADLEKTEWTTLIPGTWSLDWTMDFEDRSRTFEVRKVFADQEGEMIVRTVQVSPMGIRLAGTPKVQRGDADELRLLQLDGILTAEGCREDIYAVWSIGPEEDQLVLEIDFQKLMDPEEILGLRINGEDWFFET